MITKCDIKSLVDNKVSKTTTKHAGKSTVGALLEGFYKPTSGVVEVDGQDVATTDTAWLRGDYLGYISQVIRYKDRQCLLVK